MIRFTAHLLRHEGDPSWYSTVEALYRQRLADWLSRQGCEYSWDMDEFCVDDRSWTAINLWAPVPELLLVVE